MSKFMKLSRCLTFFALAFAVASPVRAQNATASHLSAVGADPRGNVEEVARVIQVADLLDKLRTIRTQRICGSPVSVEELAIRQDILEVVEAGSLDVDSVQAEVNSERARLFELRATLAARRDRSLGLLNVANIITGTGLGIATNALQFSNSTAKVGDNIGIVSGLGSTFLSVIALRRQHGPQQSVGKVPNMLAPLFGRQPELNTYYPPSVLEYLNSMPASESVNASRMDQLMVDWRQSGRIGPKGSAKTDQKIGRLTSSLDSKTKLSIDDISDRIAMLEDLSGRVGLMKRDLSGLMRSMRTERACKDSH